MNHGDSQPNMGEARNIRSKLLGMGYPWGISMTKEVATNSFATMHGIKGLGISILAAGLLASLGMMGCGKKATEGGKPSAAGGPGAGAAGGPPPTKVNAVVLKPQSFSAPIAVNGTLLANQEVELRAEMSGRVTQITFAEGKPVKAGAVLVQIDDAEVKANWLRTQARLKLAQAQEARVKQQLDAGAASPKDYDQAVTEKAQADAEAALLKSQLDKTQVRAPFSGVTGLLPIYAGAFVQAGTRITTLQDLSRLKLEFAVPEQEAWRVKVGSQVQFLATGRLDTLSAEVYALEPRLDAGTRALMVRAYVQNEKQGKGQTKTDNTEGLLPGGFAEVIVGGGASDSALVVAPSAVVMAGVGAVVYVPQAGKAMPRPVRLGGRTPTAVQLLSGVKAGDTVITSGFMALRPGAPVELQQVQ